MYLYYLDQSLWRESLPRKSGRNAPEFILRTETKCIFVKNLLSALIFDIRKCLNPTCLFTRLESLALSQKGFWKLSFCRNCGLWSLCFYGGNRVGLLCIAFLEERESVKMIGRMKNGLHSSFPFLQASNSEKPLSSPMTTKVSSITFPA